MSILQNMPLNILKKSTWGCTSNPKNWTTKVQKEKTDQKVPGVQFRKKHHRLLFSTKAPFQHQPSHDQKPRKSHILPRFHQTSGKIMGQILSHKGEPKESQETVLTIFDSFDWKNI